MKFLELAELFSKIEGMSSKLEMTNALASFFKKVPNIEIDKVVYLIQGSIAPPFKGIDLGVGDKSLLTAISKATGYEKDKVDELFKKTGDLGLTLEELLKKKMQRSLFKKDLTIESVYKSFTKIANASGTGSQDTKISVLMELFNSASPLEGKYLARYPTGRMRLGIGDPTILDALSIMSKGTKELRKKIEAKYNIHPDLGMLAQKFQKSGLAGIKNIKIEVGIPILPELAERLPTAEQILEKLGGKCAAEVKLDGFRVQIHKRGDEVSIFSRRLENMSSMFPDLVEATKKQVNAKTAIIEGEALAYNEDSGEFYPFQMTMQRRRKYEIGMMSKKYPLRLFLFDVLYIDGKSIMKIPYKKKRPMLKKLIKKGKVINLTEKIVTSDAKELQEFFENSIQRGLEGIIAKDLNSPYVAGARKFSWIKLKRDYQARLGDTIDVVILGGDKGHGAKAKFGYTSFLCGIYDNDNDEFKTIAKVSTGFTEAELKKMNALLKKLKMNHKPARVISKIEPDVWFEPSIVIEVKAAELTRSSMHTAKRENESDGYAMRFPRLIGWIREDKRPEDATSLAEIVKMFKNQAMQKTD